MRETTDQNAGGKSAKDVRAMFARVAPRYDVLNHLLSLGQDFYWRRAAARELGGLEAQAPIADVCAGTGDLSFAFLNAAPTARVAALDFTPEMLRLGVVKARHRAARFERKGGSLLFARGDTLHLPLRDRSCAVVGAAFGVRNLTDLDAGLREMFRILRPGGKALILEFTQPQGRFFGPLYLFYFRRILPLLGRAVARGSGDAYTYLPSSVAAFAGPQEMAERMQAAGFTPVRSRVLTFGTVHLYVGYRAPDSAKL